MAKAKKKVSRTNDKPEKPAPKADRKTAKKPVKKTAAANAKPNFSRFENALAKHAATETWSKLGLAATLAHVHEALEAQLHEVQHAIGAIEELMEAHGEQCALADVK
ncbi:MAG TPA: hypothetical protein VHZ24_19595 [Pirellulales bacterium]|jgi:hypothetical protein|nr:hypothetical protein [Pirellulales bacterium]